MLGRVFLNAMFKSCGVTSTSSLGRVGREYSSVVSRKKSESIVNISSKSAQNSQWKPLSDPEANKLLMIRLVCVGGVTVAIFLPVVFYLYHCFLPYYYRPPPKMD